MSNTEKTHTNIKSEILTLKRLVEYQTGSVVSRTLINKKTGTVTLFAFDKGESLSEHTVPYDALAYIVEGSAEITISGKSNNLKEGEMIIMPAGEPHALKAITQYKMMLVMIKS
jgi:quercetin dioxygenase-like cupin family protein